MLRIVVGLVQSGPETGFAIRPYSQSSTMPTQFQRTCLRLGYAATIFVSAFLLFQVQPIIGKTILPWFGGTPAVWTTCMLFFQVILFAGYAYAHLITRHLSPRSQAILHSLLLAVAALSLPILPEETWKPTNSENPIGRIALLLTFCVGMPYFLLSATGPLVQGWFSRTCQGESPYRLYSLSNVGSLLALGSYPFVIEPAFSVANQSWAWSCGFGLFATLCAGSALLTWRTVGAQCASIATAAAESASVARPKLFQFAMWFVLAMAPSIMLLATTNQVCMDVAVIPFLWVLPLTIYLLSFILCFDSDRWYNRRSFMLGTAMSLACVCILMMKGVTGSIVSQVLIYFTCLFFCCMVCHGELVKLKPQPAHLTAFYLTISGGGAAGGLFVGLVAPLLFTGFYEFHIGIVLVAALCVIIYLADKQQFAPETARQYLAGGLIFGAYPALALVLNSAPAGEDGRLAVTRNFYGVLRVQNEPFEHADDATRTMVHGRVVHGWQFLAPHKKHMPTTYYGQSTGAGLALQRHNPNQSRNVGVVGLGIGTLATYARPGDHYRFYEINPDVIELAQKHFDFLTDCQGQVSLVEGDARLSMEYEAPQHFDVLALDAFSGDAVPVHLLTVEALQIYQRHLKTDGVLAVHISNLYFDLEPVIAGLAKEAGWSYTVVRNKTDETAGVTRSIWCLLTPNQSTLDTITTGAEATRSDRPAIRWTDASNNLLQILK